MSCRAFWWLPLLLGSLCGQGWAADSEVTIGVLSHRGDATTLRMWAPTADYLSSQIPGHRFTVRPLDFEAVNPAVASGGIDFVLVNPGIYVNLEVAYGVARIATLNNRRRDVPYNIFGGVLFTRADRADLNTLEDLRGRTLLAVDETSLGGFQMAWREMHQVGINPYRDLGGLEFAGTHDAVVMAVRRGQVDVGTVRTDILERMQASGDIEHTDFKIINPIPSQEFPFVHSTRVYPEWPFAKAAHTATSLAHAVAVALLQMPANHSAALAGQYAGWTVPLDYQPVHELFKELKIGPYRELGRVTLADTVREYRVVILLAVALLLSLTTLLLLVWRFNRTLQQAKRGLEQQHELILKSVGDAIIGVDTSGNATFMNPAAEKLVGWEADQLIGRNLHEVLHHTRGDGTPHPAEQCPVYTTFRENQPQFVEEDLFWKRDGSAFPVEYLSSPVQDLAGQVTGAVVVFRNLTERKRAEEEAHQHRSELAHVARLSTMGELASGIAHELNQPLAAISNFTSGCIRLLRSGKWRDEQLLAAMESASGQAQRAGRIIRELRHFIRKEEPKRETLDLNQLVRSVAVLLQPEVRRADVRLDLHLDDTLPPVSVYGIQIEQVILNLARNAIESMTDQPGWERNLTIVTAQPDYGMVAVQVSDTGPGIPSQVMGRLFEPFFTTKGTGMGLGLSISHGIIYSHGGELRAANRPSGGAEFVIELPVAEDVVEQAI